MPRDGDIQPRPRREEYQPTDKLRLRVRKLAMLGVPQDAIARDAGLSVDMLRKYFSDQLHEGNIEAYASVAGALWRNAVVKDNVIAQIFWMKARHGWIDRREVNHTVGPALSHEERLKLLEGDAPAMTLPERGRAIIEAGAEEDEGQPE